MCPTTCGANTVQAMGCLKRKVWNWDQSSPMSMPMSAPKKLKKVELAEGELAVVASGAGLLIDPQEVELAEGELAVVASGAGLLINPPKGRASSCRRSLKGSTPPKMWESSHCNTMRISEITPRKRYVLACELQKCQWGLPADRICFHKLSFVCFALRSYCEYVLLLCITQIPGEYRINFISLLILLILCI